MRDFNFPINSSNLVNGLDLGTQASMDAEDLIVDDSAKGKIVEDFGTIFPGVRVSILPIDFVVEPIDCGDLPRLVVSS